MFDQLSSVDCRSKEARCQVRSYDFGLRRSSHDWKIELFRFNLKYVEGNAQLDRE